MNYVKEDIQNKFEELRACVIIPTYNNEKTLIRVIDEVLQWTNHVIVVNDGSTDSTSHLLSTRSDVMQIHFDHNKGKGKALLNGFRYAISQGYHYAITIDSDGQHYADDLPVFIAALEQNGEAVIIGARNMDQVSVPGKSSFGNKFSNFWFRVETGINCPDTQSGYRLYPLRPIRRMKFFSPKYEFEIEVLVRLAWKNIPVLPVPVKVYYGAERVSHFRPFKDFSRISVLNTVLVLITFLYIKPRDIVRTLFNRHKLAAFMRDNLLNATASDEKKALSIAFGIFMGIVPIWGFQLVTAIALAILFRLDKALTILFANISIPPMIPLILFASFQCGTLWMGADAAPMPWDQEISFDTMKLNIRQYIYGSITLAVAAAVVSGLLSYIIIKLFKRKPVLVTQEIQQ